jgi:group I intron endonuclease
MGCLYQITSPSGKSYIGISSKTTAERWAKHVEHSLGKRESGALYSALRKYGSDAFMVKTLVIADKWHYLCDLERKAIAVFGTKAPNGYNVTDGGEGVPGRVLTDEQRANLSSGQKRRYKRADQLDALAAAGLNGAKAMAGKHAEKRIYGIAPWKQRKRAASMRRGSQELRELKSALMREVMARPEVKERMIAAAKQRCGNPQWRAKISASKKGQGLGLKLSVETKAKMAEARRQWWAKREQEKGQA